MLSSRIKQDFLSPKKVIEHFGLQKEQTVLDFGAGAGYWAIPMAKMVGLKGMVTATDAREENLHIIKAKAQREGLSNIRLLKAAYSSNGLNLKDQFDLILISNILSWSKTDKEFLLSLSKNAKKGTKLVVIDFKKESPMGPKSSEKAEIEKIVGIAEKAGFIFRKLLPTGSHHFGLYFEYQG